MIAFIIMAVGGLNWLLVGAADLDLVATIFGAGTTLAKAVYIIVGLATVFELLTHKKNCSCCSK
jgi:uncharacterized membrane protein YuzA (DUF378 family)